MRPFEPMRCEHDGVGLEGLVARPEAAQRLPAVLVMPGALGMDHRIQRPLQRLVELGYLAIATDMYGAGADISNEVAAGGHFARLLEAPEVLRARTVAWFNATASRPDVDPTRIAAIGYCFGGKCVLELARSGVDVKAVVSYHGLLTTHAPARISEIKGEVAAYCGGGDALAPPEHIESLRKEMTEAGASHQITIFSEAEHGFTDPDAEAIGRPGIAFHPLADRVSWAGTVALLQATLSG